MSAVMDEMDPNGDGEVSYEEFQAWWKANMEGDAKVITGANAGADSAIQDELADLHQQSEAAVGREGTSFGKHAGIDHEVLQATSERLKAAEAAEADARSQLTALTQQLAQMKSKLTATEGERGASATELQQEVIDLRAKLDAAEKLASETQGALHLDYSYTSHPLHFCSLLVSVDCTSH